ncbi:hypothetical protein QFC19_003606 [Naganishia cerealis]|uniref:Uncharacterized protein n=1 Tax=Naganishia cerealis TaxID=610337 RepID=A0ACC2W129_9TREE|nr:hypothetical protein QFC19_003606 [Naganishia cerealis]
MSSNSQDSGTVTKDKLQHDLAILESQATLLDSFLPPPLQYGHSHAQKSTSSSSAVTLDNYSPKSSTPEDSVALSYSFVDVTRNGALKLAVDGDGGVIGKLGENIEHVGSDAEQLQKSLEGL